MCHYTALPPGFRVSGSRFLSPKGSQDLGGSSMMTPHRLRSSALHLPARRSRQSANVIQCRSLKILAGCDVSAGHEGGAESACDLRIGRHEY